MKANKIFMLGILVFFSSISAIAQITGSLSVTYSSSDSKYHIFFTPNASGTQVLGAGSLVGITAPTTSGPTGFAIGPITSVNGTWTLGVNDLQGTGGTDGGSTSLDYWSFVLNNDPNVTLVSGVPLELFNVSGTGSCNGGSLNINPATGTVISSSGAGSVILDPGSAFSVSGTSTTTDVTNLNTALCVQASPAISCATAPSLSPSNYTIGTPASGSLTIQLSNIAPGSYQFTETTAANFVTNPVVYSTSLAAGATSVTIPVSYDGGGTAGTQTVTIQMTDPSGAVTTSTCTAIATLSAVACKTGTTAPTIPTATIACSTTTSTANLTALGVTCPSGTNVAWYTGTTATSLGIAVSTPTSASINAGQQYNAVCIDAANPTCTNSSYVFGTVTATPCTSTCQANAGTLN